MKDPAGIPVRGTIVFGLLVVALLVGGFGYWSATANISGAVIAAGRIEVDQNRQVVQHPDGGVVERISVKEGDIVATSDVLVSLDDSRLLSNLAIIEVQLFEIMARRARLEAEQNDADTVSFDPELVEKGHSDPEIQSLMDGQTRLFTATLETYAEETQQLGKRSAQVSDQIAGIDAQLEAMTVQLGLIAKEKEDQQTLLSRGLAQASRVLALQREEARLRGTVGELTARRSQAEGRITEFELEILRRKAARRENAIAQLRDLEYRELELSEQRRSLQTRLERLEIRAPVSGVVYDMQVFARKSVILPAEPILFIVPQDRPFVISGQVETIHVDQVYSTQDVAVRLPTFNQRTTPELAGTVTKVSPDAFRDEQTGAAYYKVEIVLNEGELAKLPDDAVLVPGMPVEAYMQTSARTLAEYLIQPFTDYFKKAFRES